MEEYIDMLMPSLSPTAISPDIRSNFYLHQTKVDSYIGPSFTQYFHPTQRKPTKIHPINITEKWPREPHQRRQRRKYLAKLIEPDDGGVSNKLGRSNGSETSQRCRQPLDAGSASAKSAWRSKYLIVAQSPYATIAMSTIQT